MKEHLEHILKKILTAIALMSLLGGCLLFCGIKAPDSVAGVMTLQTLYRTLGAERALPIYNSFLLLDNYAGMPLVNDRFLVRKLLDNDTSDRERGAIVDFYLERGAGASTVYLTAHKREVFDVFLTQIDTKTPLQRLKILVLLQELETGHRLLPQQFAGLAESALPEAARILENWEIYRQKHFMACGED